MAVALISISQAFEASQERESREFYLQSQIDLISKDMSELWDKRIALYQANEDIQKKIDELFQEIEALGHRIQTNLETIDCCNRDFATLSVHKEKLEFLKSTAYESSEEKLQRYQWTLSQVADCKPLLCRSQSLKEFVFTPQGGQMLRELSQNKGKSIGQIIDAVLKEEEIQVTEGDLKESFVVDLYAIVFQERTLEAFFEARKLAIVDGVVTICLKDFFNYCMRYVKDVMGRSRSPNALFKGEAGKGEALQKEGRRLLGFLQMLQKDRDLFFQIWAQNLNDPDWISNPTFPKNIRTQLGDRRVMFHFKDE